MYIPFMSQDSASRKLDKFMLRFPDGMRDEIREAAEKSGRSMNAEIVHRLQLSLSVEAHAATNLSETEKSVEKLTEKLETTQEKVDEFMKWLERETKKKIPF